MILYSSHRVYLGLDAATWVTSDFGLSLFSGDVGQARQAYQHFMAQSCDQDIEAAAHPEDSRIIGDDNFMRKIPAVRYQPRSNLTLEQLAAKLCLEHDIEVDSLRSSSRARRLTPIRVELTQQAVHLRVATLTEVAAFLHRDPSGLSKLINRLSEAICP